MVYYYRERNRPMPTHSSVRGKHRFGIHETNGDNWIACDQCSRAIKASDAKTQWDGLIVCPDHYDPRHPGDMPQPTYPERPPEIVRPIRFRYQDGTEVYAGQGTGGMGTGLPLSDIMIVNANEDYLQVDAAQPNDYLSWE
jgi:hypothetical protein